VEGWEEVAGEPALRHAGRHPVDSFGRAFGDRHGDPLDASQALGGSLYLGIRLVGLDVDHQFEFVVARHMGLGEFRVARRTDQ
jgi:hypothetical protein